MKALNYSLRNINALQKSKYWFPVFFVLACTFLFLGGTNIFSMAGYFIAIGSFLLFLSIPIYDNKLYKFTYLTIFFGFLYIVNTIVNQTFEFVYIFYYFVTPLLWVQIGHHYADKTFVLILSFLSLFLGYFYRGVEPLITAFSIQGLSIDKNFLFSIMTGTVSPIVRTVFSTFYIPIISLLLGLSLFSNYQKNKVFIIFLFFVNAFGFFVSMAIGNRSFLIIYITLILLYLYFLSKKFSRYIKIVRTFLIVILFLVFIFLCFYLGIFPVPDFLKDIYIFNRFLSGGSNSERLALYGAFFKNFIFYPFGGMQNILLKEGDSIYVHNIFFDTYVHAGIAPFIIFAFITYRIVKIFYLDYQIFGKNSDVIVFVFVCFGIYLLGMFEPLFQGNPWLLSIIFCVYGYLNYRLKKIQKISVNLKRYTLKI